MEILLWIIFGGVVGWFGSILMNTDSQQGVVMNVVVGIVGALLGGYIMNFFGAAGVSGFNFYSFVVALIGSVVLLSVVKLVRRS
jgi:uncharacterized membrane protein YeaQ/YmgE (transglycosylase-associated protein family)